MFELPNRVSISVIGRFKELRVLFVKNWPCENNIYIYFFIIRTYYYGIDKGKVLNKKEGSARCTFRGLKAVLVSQPQKSTARSFAAPFRLLSQNIYLFDNQVIHNFVSFTSGIHNSRSTHSVNVLF